MTDKTCFFILGAGIMGIILNIVNIIIQRNCKSKEIENTSDTNKCNVDLSSVYSELNALYTEIINMDLRHSQTNKLTSHIHVIEHILYRLENGDE